MGRGAMGMGAGRSIERMEENAAALRVMVDSGSPRIVRNDMEGGSVRERRRFCPSIGTRSGSLTVTGYVIGSRGGLVALIVACDCGFPEYTVEASNFKAFKTTRCNRCAKLAAGKKRHWKYHEVMPEVEHRSRLLDRLYAAINRCHNEKDAGYVNYGGRGICVCDLWRSDKAEFLSHVRTIHGWDIPALEIDRVDVDGNYEPGNIRFISKAENSRNKRKMADLERRIGILESEREALEQRVAELEQELCSLRRNKQRD